MRTATIDLKGTIYTLCYSARVATKVEERSGSVKEEMEKLSNGSIAETFWMLSQMLDAGERYDRMEGNDPPKPPTYDELVDSIGSDQFGDIYVAVAKALTAGSTPTVEVKPSKKGKGATQAE